MSSQIYDFIAIGLGPFNLSLACLTSNIKDLNGLFLEKKQEFNWHPGMMLESAHLQTPFMSDLVTLADPTHPLSFLNYKKLQGRLYSFYIREDFFLMRQEYNQYCRWAIEQLNNIAFNQQVDHVNFDESTGIYTVSCVNPQTNDTQQYLCKKLVLGTGPSPALPDSAKGMGDKSIHTSNYLFNKKKLQQQSSITIVGGGQSAAEIYYDLLQEIDIYGYDLHWVTQSPRFFPLEYSKLTLEMTSPEYVDYFYSLPEEKRDALNKTQKNLYKGINQSLINDIFDLLYVKQLNGDFNSQILSNSSFKGYKKVEDELQLAFLHHEQEQAFILNTQSVIFATGYQHQLPEFIESLRDQIQWDKHERFAVNRNYTIDKRQSIFVQNGELHTHGFVTPDLGMACYRNSCIIRELLGYEFYPIEKKIAFQHFGAPQTVNVDTPENAFAVELKS
ncbi:L-lysine N6-monooxygenase [Thalassocella blandensis]|nr:L-lysine N6-monooxygenase [Thalassocella blandensis]